MWSVCCAWVAGWLVSWQGVGIVVCLLVGGGRLKKESGIGQEQGGRCLVGQQM